MEQVQVTKVERQVLDAMRASTKLQSLIVALVEVAQSGELSTKSAGALDRAAATLPAPGTSPTVSIEQMKNELRAADCLYDKAEIWKQLGAKNVPAIPASVIQKAYEEGGRVVLECSSISEKADALRKAGCNVYFGGAAEQQYYTENVSNPEWIVVQSHIDTDTLGSPKRDVVTADKPAPTSEDWFAAIAYARLDGRRQPQGCENLYAFTTKSGTVVGSDDDGIDVDRDDCYDHDGNDFIGVARFGPPRN
jgi:hypothetical protein